MTTEIRPMSRLEAEVTVLQVRHDIKHREYIALVKCPKEKRPPEYARRCAVLSSELEVMARDIAKANRWLHECDQVTKGKEG